MPVRADGPAEDRLAAWREAVGGSPELLAARLSWDGLEAPRAAALLSGVRLAEGAEPPAWTRTLAAVLETLDSSASVRAARVDDLAAATIQPGRPLSFEPLLLPFVRHAAAALESRVEDRAALLSDRALTAALRQLLQILCRQASETLHQEFLAFRAERETVFDRIARASDGEARRGLYEEFVEQGLAGGLAEILAEHAFLARQLATAVDDWVDALEELAGRLRRDGPRLAAVFHEGRAPGPAVDLRAGLSDPHAGGRSVMVLAFASGLEVVYKPKSLAIDRAWFDLLAWINATGELLPLQVLRGVEGDGYGWMEHVPHRPCAGEAEIARFYRRTGFVLALTYALEGYDCHHENVIADGEQPVLVDLETLMNPSPGAVVEGRDDLPPAAAVAMRQYYESVIRTGLLPSWRVSPAGIKADTSMLGGQAGQLALSGTIAWEDVNTDRMRPVYKHQPIPPQANLPHLAGGGAVSPDPWLDEICAGFREMYGFLLRHRAELLESPDLLPCWGRTSVRYVRRVTRQYGQLLRRLRAPALLRDGAAWSLAVERLGRSDVRQGRPADWALHAHERAQLARMDVPYFRVAADGRDVLDAAGRPVVPGRFHTTPHERLLARVKGLSAGDLPLQEGYIRSMFEARHAGGLHAPAAGGPAERSADAEPLTAADCIAEAEAIGEELWRRAVRSGPRSATWIALDPVRLDDACQFRPIGFNLHSGSAGVAVFLAALARVTGKERYRELALAALDTPRGLDLKDGSLLRAIGLGCNVGLASVIYAFALAGQLLEETALYDSAREAALQVTEEALAADDRLDVVFGAAGCILGLLKLHRLTHDPDVLEAAARCGRHLLSRATPVYPGRACPTLDRRHQTGFSHGAAGIALALARLSQATGEPAFGELAVDEVAWEEGQLLPEQRNYRDLRVRDGEPVCMASWCHGAPGIGLSRLALHDLSGDPDLRRQADLCAGTAREASADTLDTLCCGNFGRVEILSEHARRTGDETSARAARRLAARAVARAREAGGFRLFDGVGATVFSPGLFTGWTGIGYALLRLARPGELPCVLAFD